MYHFNPCLQTAVKTKQNKKQKAKIFNADGPCLCGIQTSPKYLPFRDVHDVGISALKKYIVAAGDHRFPDAADRTALKYVPVPCCAVERKNHM